MSVPTTFLDGRITLHGGDCLDVLDALPAKSLHACVCDPPYHLASIVKRFGGKTAAPAKSNGKTGVFKRASAGFMGKQWDGGEIAFQPETWEKVFRVLKPGGYLLAFAAPKNVHWLTGAIEMAGFEIRDRLIEFICLDPLVERFLDSLNEAQADAFLRLLYEGVFGELQWVFGQGFPKSLKLPLAIDKHFGKKGEILAVGAPVRRIRPGADQEKGGSWEKLKERTYQPGEYIPATDEAAEWRGWETALKPAYEPIVMARKPVEGTNAENVLTHGVGGINVDACRITMSDEDAAYIKERISGFNQTKSIGGNGAYSGGVVMDRSAAYDPTKGRHPANLLHDGSAAATGGFPITKSGELLPHHSRKGQSLIGTFQIRDRTGELTPSYSDSGFASRFFYSAKADQDDRLGSKHPTVKPVDLMRYLVRLVTPPGGTVLDPFAGTGTTGEAAYREGFSAILIEREQEYRADIARRMDLMLAGRETRKVEAQKARGNTPGIDDLPLFGGGGNSPTGGGGPSTESSQGTRPNHRADRIEEVRR